MNFNLVKGKEKTAPLKIKIIQRQQEITLILSKSCECAPKHLVLEAWRAAGGDNYEFDSKYLELTRKSSGQNHCFIEQLPHYARVQIFNTSQKATQDPDAALLLFLRCIARKAFGRVRAPSVGMLPFMFFDATLLEAPHGLTDAEAALFSLLVNEMQLRVSFAPCTRELEIAIYYPQPTESPNAQLGLLMLKQVDELVMAEALALAWQRCLEHAAHRWNATALGYVPRARLTVWVLNKRVHTTSPRANVRAIGSFDLASHRNMELADDFLQNLRGFLLQK